MDEHSAIKHHEHILLDQPLLRLPFELLRNNFRAAHFTAEKDSTSIKSLLKETATASVNGRASPDQIVKNLDTMIAKMRGVKRKLDGYAEEEDRLYHQLDARTSHLAELYGMHSYEDVKYETWSRKRLDRLLVDYLLRNGYDQSAAALTSEKGMDDLVDVQTFLQRNQIVEALQNHSVAEALTWCQENKKELRKMESNLEFMLRFQQYIELVRSQSQPKLIEAITHAKKYLVPHKAAYPEELRKAFGLLAYPPHAAAAAYAELYSSERWQTLADLFRTTHAKLFALPPFPLLHIALSAGLSALKTPACHSTSRANAIAASEVGSRLQNDPASPELHHRHDTDAPVAPSEARPAITDPSAACPICSTELNDLARDLPCANHLKSQIDSDLILLPNGIAYSKEKLDDYARKSGLDPDVTVRDLRTGHMYKTDDTTKVYIT